ncbi:MAG: sensor histidine kinase [Allobaculum sp.]
MRELRRKVILSLFMLFTVLIVLVTAFTAYQSYRSAYDQMHQALNIVSKSAERTANPNEYGPWFSSSADQTPTLDELEVISETPICLVMLDADDSIIRIYVSNSVDDEMIRQTIYKSEQIVQNFAPGTLHIGNLYTDRCSWSYVSNRAIAVASTQVLQKRLLGVLTWLIIFAVLFAIILFFICLKVTDWMIAPIQQTLDKQKQFVADASHELKTPVAVILANAEAMEQDHDEHWLKNIEEEATRMNSLITSLLDLTRSEQTDPVLERVNLSRLLEKQSLIMEAAMFEKNLVLEEEIEPDLMIMANSAAIQQVVAILIDNAIEHSDGKVIAKAMRKGREVQFSISNTGKPIPEADRERIFERFYRADTSRNRASGRYGLGLAIAKSIVESHHGRIQVSCAQGITTFSVTLKMAPELKETKTK